MENETDFSKGLKDQEFILKELLAKSLVIFVAVGAVSGFAYGLYLMDFEQTSQLVYVEGSSLSIVTEKSDFKQDEQIRIRIVNSGTVPLTFPDASYGLRITGLSGILMYSPVAAQVISELKPGDEAEFVWDQIKNDGDRALEGLYKISAKGADTRGDTVSRSITVTIWKQQHNI